MKVFLTPKDYQKKAVEFSLSREGSIIAIETGGGKTLTMIFEAFFRLKKGDVDKVIQVCTKKSKHSFASDYKEHTDYYKEILVINDVEDFRVFYNDNNFKIAVVQYETFRNIPADFWETFLKKYRTLMQFDEYHKLKQPMTELAYSYDGKVIEQVKKKQTMICSLVYRLRPHIKYLTGYTATPITSSISDAFWLSTLTKPGIFSDSLLTFFNSFVRYYCYPKKIGRLKKLCTDIKGYANLEILRDKIKSICFSHFPKKDIKFIPAEVGINEQDYADYLLAVRGGLDKYKAREVDKETGEVEDKTFSARMVDAQYVLDNSQGKKNMLDILIDQTVQVGVLVYCHYYNTLDVVKSVLDKKGVDFRVIDGTTSDRNLEKHMKWFNSNPMNKVVILSSAGAQSLNLQSTNNMIFYNLPYTAGGFLQAIGRMIRLGSKYTSFNVYFPMVKDTLDTYKYTYVGSNAELLAYLQGNENLFQGECETFDSYFLREMRKLNLWSKK